MRAVIQRVLSASVEVDGTVVSSINYGLLLLLGIHNTDTDTDIDYIISKTIGLRIFDDLNGVMNLSAEDTDSEILIVSQFTLYGDVRKGKRPSYSDAMPPEKASAFYEKFISEFSKRFPKIKCGVFGADMKVLLVNSGPVTIMLDSSKIF
jgi:D-tyrosyl-tRNA(Tyr) deacylase